MLSVSPLSLVLDELEVVEVLVVPGRDLDVVEEPLDDAVRALDGAVQVEGGLLFLATGLQHLRELARLVCVASGKGRGEKWVS